MGKGVCLDPDAPFCACQEMSEKPMVTVPILPYAKL